MDRSGTMNEQNGSFRNYERTKLRKKERARLLCVKKTKLIILFDVIQLSSIVLQNTIEVFMFNAPGN